MKGDSIPATFDIAQEDCNLIQWRNGVMQIRLKQTRDHVFVESIKVGCHFATLLQV